MPAKAIIPTGETFGTRLTILEEVPSISKSRDTRVKARCICGKVIEVNLHAIKSKRTVSCGCYRTEQIARANHEHPKRLVHGHKRRSGSSLTYSSYMSMISRCYKESTDSYYLYGGRSIIVCHRWLESFQNFLEDMGERPIGTTIYTY